MGIGVGEGVCEVSGEGFLGGEGGGVGVFFFFFWGVFALFLFSGRSRGWGSAILLFLPMAAFLVSSSGLLAATELHSICSSVDGAGRASSACFPSVSGESEVAVVTGTLRPFLTTTDHPSPETLLPPAAPADLVAVPPFAAAAAIPGTPVFLLGGALWGHIFDMWPCCLHSQHRGFLPSTTTVIELPR